MKVIQCWIEHPVRSIDQTFTYLCDDDEVQKYARVSIDFNGRNIIGFVEEVEDTSLSVQEIQNQYGFEIKFVDRVIDQEPLLTQELHDLALSMRNDTLSTTISCFSCMLPAIIKPVSGNKHAVKEEWVSVSDIEVSLTPKEVMAYQFVQERGYIKYSELRKKFPNQALNLRKKGAIVVTKQERNASLNEHEDTENQLPLTPAQKIAKEDIETSTNHVVLFRGVTGSGKTEIYLQLAKKVLTEGKQVLILVPEIGLTPQMIERVSNRFGQELAIYHSGLNAQEKYEQYKKVKNGIARIVVGTRSAVFLPFTDLGLIVMDEEHDSSYKQDKQPAYHCRDIAIWRGNYHQCKVILGSATPSLDSYARGLKDVYHLVELDERVNQTLPAVTVVNMQEALKQENPTLLSAELIEKMGERLDAKEKIILLLNRRGYSTQLRCRDCGEVIQCPHCDLAMSYHRQIHKLKCHTCGFEMRVPHSCASCGSTSGFVTYGYGTEKLEEQVQQLFPGIRTLRMDADTTSRKNSHAKILKEFGEGDADVLLGTQMIAKGLDYPSVTLVGIINGDQGIERSDFRSCELAFDLLMQAEGRSGRGKHPGEVICQVFHPDHYAVQCASRQDYRAFFQKEMQFRHAGQYPPYTYMISLLVRNRNEKKTDEIALWLKQNLTGNYKTIGVISLIKINDFYRSRVVLKGKNLEEMRKDIRALMEKDKSNRINSIQIDVNPIALE